MHHSEKVTLLIVPRHESKSLGPLAQSGFVVVIMFVFTPTYVSSTLFQAHTSASWPVQCCKANTKLLVAMKSTGCSCLNVASLKTHPAMDI